MQSDFTRVVAEASKLEQGSGIQSDQAGRAGPGPPMLAPREPSKPRSLTPTRSAQSSTAPPPRPHSLMHASQSSSTGQTPLVVKSTIPSQHVGGMSSRMQDAIAAAAAAPPPNPPSPEQASSAAPAAQHEPARSRLDIQPSSRSESQESAAAESVYSREQKLQDTLARANATLAEFRARVGAPAPSQAHMQGSPQWLQRQSAALGNSPWQQQQQQQRQQYQPQPQPQWHQQQQHGALSSPGSYAGQHMGHVINWGPGSAPSSPHGLPPQPSPQSSQRPSPATMLSGARILFSSSGSGHSPSPFGGGAFPPAPPGQQHPAAQPAAAPWSLPPRQPAQAGQGNSAPSSRSSSPDSSAAAATAVLEAHISTLKKQLKEEQDARKKLQEHIDGLDTRAGETLQSLVAQLSSAGVQVRLPNDKQPPNAVGIQGGAQDDLASAVLAVPQLPASTSEAVVAALAAERARFGAREAAIRDEMGASSRWYQDMARRAEEDVVAVRDKATMDALDAEASASGSRKAFEQRVRQRSMQVISELRAEIQGLEGELEAAHARHTSLEQQVRSQFEAHCRSFENRLRGRASAAISAIRHASEVAAQHHYTRQLRAARDSIKQNLLQQSVAGVVDMTAVDKLFADLALMPMLSSSQSHLTDWTADIRASAAGARRPSDVASVGGAEGALQSVMFDSQAAASEALEFFTTTLQGAKTASAASTAPAPALTPVLQVKGVHPPITPPKPPSAPPALASAGSAAPPGNLPQPDAPAAAFQAPVQSMAVPSTASPRSLSANSHTGAGIPPPPRPPPGVAARQPGRTSTSSAASSTQSVHSRHSVSSEERPSAPPSASSLPQRRALAARTKPGLLRTNGNSPAHKTKTDFLKVLHADASSFRRAPAGAQVAHTVIHDGPVNPTRARRLRKQNSPSPTGKVLGNKIRARVFK